ncbi:DUF1868 domain-containing protein [Roseobacter sinensis]|uniref:DUF1868 domain-containing protein n=1 Tax=Roseobacter sinensis TaxID=2931391 RepID=A0ABT3BBY0_9RHOB|nr:DUF1868 domain-containing protein [Roseobacter sp. WL0113]MCV3271087.1 DUF1868 domain-containing protein [Roseobacter sp. WL0113]
MASDDIAQYAASNNPAPPARLGQRYDETRFLPEPGNTVVCHLDTETPAHQAVLDARTRLRALPGAERFLYTPVSSLHMTVFEGVIDTRRTADAWPAGIDRDASVADVTETLRKRLEDFSGPPDFSVRAIGLLPTGLVLAGATAEDERVMRDWREALVQPFGYRHDDHDAYGFHMTFAYPTTWLPDELLPLWRAECAAILADLTAAAPRLPLRPPAFCTFEDMTAFPEVLELRRGSAG